MAFDDRDDRGGDRTQRRAVAPRRVTGMERQRLLMHDDTGPSRAADPSGLDAAAPDIHQPVNIGNPVEFTVAQLADLVLEFTGGRSEIEHRPLPVDDPKVRQPDITRARALLGFEPRVPLE